MQKLTFFSKHIILISLLFCLYGCSKFDAGDQVWIAAPGTDPGALGYASGRIVSINGDLAEVKIRKAGNVPSSHELVDELRANEIVFINVDQITDYETGKANYDNFANLNNKVKSTLRKIRSKIVNGRISQSDIEKLAQYEQLANQNSQVDYASAIKLLKASLQIFPSDMENIKTYLDWSKQAPTLLQSLLSDEMKPSQQGLSTGMLSRVDREQNGKYFIKKSINEPLENVYQDTLMLAFGLLEIPVAGIRLVSEEQGWQYYGQLKHVTEQINDFNKKYTDQVLYSYADANQLRKLEYFQEDADEEVEKIETQWLKAVKRTLVSSVSLDQLISEAEAESAFNKLKKQVATLEQELQIEILTLDDLDMIFLAAVEKNIKRSELVDIAQQQEFEQVQRQLWAKVNVDNIFSHKSADQAYQKLLESAELNQLAFTKPLISAEHKQQLYQAVEDNQPRKKAAELKLQQQLVALASNFNLLSEQDVEQAMLNLQPEINNRAKTSGLNIDPLAIETALLAKLQTNQLADRKLNLFKNNKKWYVRFFELNPKGNSGNTKLKDSELFCELTLAADGEGQMICPVTPKKSSITYDALWQVAVSYVPATARVQLEMKKLLDGPRNTPRGSRRNPGKALVESNYQKISGQVTDSSNFNNFSRYELRLQPFVLAQAPIEIIADDGGEKSAIKPQILIAKSSKLGVEAYAIGNSQNWCKPDIEVELKSTDSQFYQNGQVGTFIKKLGIVIEKQCERATNASLVGKAKGTQILYRANATKSQRWLAIPSSS